MKMAAAAEAYLGHLETEGRSPSTCGTAKRTLALLVAHLGAEREADEVVDEDLDGFFASDAATKQRGQPRAAASVAQLRGIVRAAFAWWNQQGHGKRQEPAKAPPAFAPTSHATQPPAPTAAPVAAPALATKPAPTTQPLAPMVAPVAAPAPTRAAYLDLTYQGQLVRFAKTEIDRARLYGLRKLVALDAQGRECQSVLLTRDGRHVLQPGSTADLYINECGDAVPRRELVTVTDARTPLSAVPPAVNDPPEIQGPLNANELLDHAVIRVHSLQPVIVPAKLAQALGTGEVFRVPYRSRPGATETPAFLLAGDAGAFLILAEPHGFDCVGPDQPALPETDPDEDDLDAFAFPDTFGVPHEPA